MLLLPPSFRKLLEGFRSSGPGTGNKDQVDIYYSITISHPRRLLHRCWLARAGGGREWPTRTAGPGLLVAPQSLRLLASRLPLAAAPRASCRLLFPVRCSYPWICHRSPHLVFQKGYLFRLYSIISWHLLWEELSRTSWDRIMGKTV